VALIRDENDERSARIDAIIAELERANDGVRKHIEESKRSIETTDRAIKRGQTVLRGKRRASPLT
jgi:hypothetical protein